MSNPRNDSPASLHQAARPMKFVKDKEGNAWLCDKHVDTEADLASQGCWRCEDMAFPMGN